MAREKLSPMLQRVALVRDDDFYMGLDDIAFRTCVQEKAHHSLEIQVCHAEHTGCEMFPQRPLYVYLFVRRLSRASARAVGSPRHEPRPARIPFCAPHVDMANDYLDGKPIDLSPYAPKRLTPEETEGF